MSHTYGDERIVEWLQENDYHPRSPRHGGASCMFLLDDLLYESDAVREAAEAGEIVYQEDYTVGEGQDRWNTDLVIGPPTEEAQTQLSNVDRPIAEAELQAVWLAIDAKSVMTEHQKARRNRQRDINSFADIMHTHFPGAVTGGLLLVNVAERFKSPLRGEDDITDHDRIEQLVEETVEIFRTINRAEGEVSPNVDAVGTVVVEHTNMDDGESTELVTDPPAPQRGDIVHYRDFLEIIVDTFETRFLGEDASGLTAEDELTNQKQRLNRLSVELAYQIRVLTESDEIDTDEQLEALKATLHKIENIAEDYSS